MRVLRLKLRASAAASRLAAILAVIVVVAVGWLALGGDDQRGHAATPARMFAPTSFWNAPLPPGVAVDPLSAALVNDLVTQVRMRGAWINSHRFSTPIYTVGPLQRRVPVAIDRGSDMFTNESDAAALERQLSAVPIPKNARPAAGTDSHLVVWQPSTDTMWELWQAHSAGAWRASWGARIDRVSQNPGVDRYPFGATASGLPVAGGLIRIDELRAGSIDHALALAIPFTASRRVRAPANRTDGQDPTPTAIPEGTRFRLDPSLDVESLHLHPVARAIAIAAQRHGIVVRDRAKLVVFYAEDPRGAGGDPYPAITGGKSAGEVLAGFPWNRLQVLVPRGTR